MEIIGRVKSAHILAANCCNQVTFREWELFIMLFLIISHNFKNSIV